MSKDADIPREDDTLLEIRYTNDFFIMKIVPVQGIETQEAEVTSQRAQVTVEDEPGLAQGFWPESDDG